jgi:galactokinase
MDQRHHAGDGSAPAAGDVVSRVGARFLDRYGIAPQCVWHAPGRVNLIGEHTDYNDGLVLPFALGSGTVAAAAVSSEPVLELSSAQEPGAVVRIRLDRLAPGSVTGWAAYPAGVAWALREAGHHIPGARVAIESDLPRGAGLASSAALECAVIMALAGLAGLAPLDLPRSELAGLARRAENDFVGMPCGIMDQAASLLCEAGHALLLDCRSGDTTSVPLDPAVAGLTLLIIDTRARHALTGSEYGARRQDCAAAAREIGVGSLRELTDVGDIPGSLADPVLRRRVRHVITENQRVGQAARLLLAGELGSVGALLSESHRSLRDDFEVSWPEADVAVAAAVSAGALGARMTGGGFGGCVLALLPSERDARVRAEVSAALAAGGRRQPGFLAAVPAAGARQVS